MDEQDTIMLNGQRIPDWMLQGNAPRDMWWEAAHNREVIRKPLTRWILDTPVVLYRLETGYQVDPGWPFLDGYD